MFFIKHIIKSLIQFVWFDGRVPLKQINFINFKNTRYRLDIKCTNTEYILNLTDEWNKFYLEQTK